MNSGDRSLAVVSGRFLAYLRGELNEAGINYDVPLTPMLGGYDAFTYHFKLKGVPQDLTRPLVLRLFREYEDPERAVRESAVQNQLAAIGYPAPKVLSACTDKSQLGGVFLIMDFMSGENMLAAEGGDLPVMLGKAHATLHSITPDRLVEALRALDFEEQRFRLSGRMNWLSAKRELLPWLAESVQWLIENRPREPELLSICHGDFHPLNILVQDGKVTAVLDWPGFMIGDPAMDVACTIVLVTIAARSLLPEQDWDRVLGRYLQAYCDERPLDLEHLCYYKMLRCVAAFVDGAKGQEVWRSPSALQNLIEHVYDISGIRVAAPSGNG